MSDEITQEYQYRFNHATSYMELRRIEQQRKWPPKIVFRGSNAMLIELGMSLPDVLLSEWNLGLMLCMTAPRDYAESVNAIVTHFSDSVMELMFQEMEIIHRMNQAYYADAHTFGADHRLLFCPRQENTPLENEFNGPSGVTAPFIQRLLADGFTLVSDRSDHTICEVLHHEGLKEMIDHFNDKNYFFRFLSRHADGIPFPAAIVIDELPSDGIQSLLEADDSEIFARFNRMITDRAFPYEGAFIPGIPYFLKVSASAGGNSIEPSLVQLMPAEENIKIFRGILQNLLRRNQGNFPMLRGLQLLTPVTTTAPNWKNPIDPRNTVIYSPCLTLRIDQDGTTSMGQVADQMLKGGNTWAGSYWEKALERKFTDQVGLPRFISLAHKIAKQGYFGYFGTDFILGNDGQYSLVIDPNGRMNGNDNIFFTKSPFLLHQPRSVESAFLAIVKIGETKPQALERLYQETLTPYIYTPTSQTGAVLFPQFRKKYYTEPTSERFVKVVYLNPKRDTARFTSFFEKLVNIE